MQSINSYPSLADVQYRILNAIVNLYRYDRELFEVDANERSITHKLAEHLQREFPQWHVDCEYNRCGFNVKKLIEIHNNHYQSEINNFEDTEARSVFPDIIVHKRTTHLNLLVIEVKKDNNSDSTIDIEKLKAFGQDENYHYQFGLFLRLGPTGCTEIQFYIEGENIQEEGELLHQLIQDNLKELGYGG